MHKRLLGALVGIALLMTLCLNVLAAYSDHTSRDEAALASAPVTSAADLLDVAYTTLNAEPESSERVIPNLAVNGSPFTDTVIAKASGNIYVSIRTAIERLDPNAQIAWENNQFVANGSGFHLTARPGDLYLVVNGRYLYASDGIVLQNGVTFAPIQAIAKALGCNVDRNVMTGDMSITSTGVPLKNGASYYHAEDLYWLSRIITAESRNQPLPGKIAVGTVILNRVNNPRYPDTIRGVIFDGNQFDPVKSGSIYLPPTTEGILAAKLVLDGAREAKNSLFFNNASLNSWAAQNRTYVTTIADHSFYL